MLVKQSFFYKKLLYKKLVFNFLANYNRKRIDYCSHSNKNKRKIKKLSVLRLDLSFFYEKIKCTSFGVAKLTNVSFTDKFLKCSSSDVSTFGRCRSTCTAFSIPEKILVYMILRNQQYLQSAKFNFYDIFTICRVNREKHYFYLVVK